MTRAALIERLVEAIESVARPHPIRVAIDERTYRTAVFDHRADATSETPPSRAPDDAILLLDGVFLLRPELAGSWDLCILVTVGFDEVLRRAIERDRSLFRTEAEVERRYRSRYIPGQQLYYAVARPEESADLIVDNSDPERPRLRVRPAPESPAG